MKGMYLAEEIFMTPPNGSGGTSHPYLSMSRLGAYLYDVSFATLQPDRNVDFVTGACTSYVKDGKLYRNLDLGYTERASFYVHCSGFEGMSVLDGLTDTSLDDALIAQLPYHMVDGINDYGIKAAAHVLFNDWDWHGVSNGIPLTKLIYHILSSVKSMTTLETDLAGVLTNLCTTSALDSHEYLMQFLVTDGITTKAILPPESSRGTYTVVDITENPKLTNFRWVEDEIVDRTSLQNRPTGVERWNMIPTSLETLRFTSAYEAPDRLSEFIGIDETTKDSTDAELEVIYNKAHEEYLERTRNGSTWQTMHSVVYGASRMESLYVQENWAKDYVGTSSSWADITNKPFENLGEGLMVDEDGEMSADVTADDVENKLTEPASGMAVGKYFRIASIDENGHAVLEAVDELAAGKVDYTDVADAYDNTSTYAVGDYCIYGNKLYKCNTAITTAEEWTAAHWTAVKISEEFYTKPLVGNVVPSASGDYKLGQLFFYDLNQVNKKTDLLIYTPNDSVVSPENIWRTVITSRQNPTDSRFEAVSGDGFGANHGQTVAVGYKAGVTGYGGIAFGWDAKALGTKSFIFGRGYNRIDNTFAVGFYEDQEAFTMLNSDGSIPFARMNIVKSTMDSVAVAGASYFLGEQSTVSITLPSSAEVGQQISVVFYSGETVATLSVSGDIIGDVPAPAANQRVEINLLWDGSYWAIVSNVLPVPEEETE